MTEENKRWRPGSSVRTSSASRPRGPAAGIAAGAQAAPPRQRPLSGARVSGAGVAGRDQLGPQRGAEAASLRMRRRVLSPSMQVSHST